MDLMFHILRPSFVMVKKLKPKKVLLINQNCHALMIPLGGVSANRTMEEFCHSMSISRTFFLLNHPALPSKVKSTLKLIKIVDFFAMVFIVIVLSKL